jgi:hypothetical protein
MMKSYEEQQRKEPSKWCRGLCPLIGLLYVAAFPVMTIVTTITLAAEKLVETMKSENSAHHDMRKMPPHSHASPLH